MELPPPQQPDPVAVPSANENGPPKGSPSSSSGGLPWGWIIVIVVVLGVGAYFVFAGDEEEDANTSSANNGSDSGEQTAVLGTVRPTIGSTNTSSVPSLTFNGATPGTLTWVDATPLDESTIASGNKVLHYSPGATVRYATIINDVGSKGPASYPDDGLFKMVFHSWETHLVWYYPHRLGRFGDVDDWCLPEGFTALIPDEERKYVWQYRYESYYRNNDNEWRDKDYNAQEPVYVGMQMNVLRWNSDLKCTAYIDDIPFPMRLKGSNNRFSTTGCFFPPESHSSCIKFEFLSSPIIGDKDKDHRTILKVVFNNVAYSETNEDDRVYIVQKLNGPRILFRLRPGDNDGDGYTNPNGVNRYMMKEQDLDTAAAQLIYFDT
jgi:hypothetical protein